MIYLIKKISLLVVLIVLVSSLKAQQELQFTQYMFNQMAFNPGYAGSSGNISVTGNLREQWVGFKDMEGEKIAPSSQSITVDAPIDFLHGGAGLTIINDKLGYEKNIALRFAYAYQFDMFGGQIGVGPQIELTSRTLDFSKLKPAQAGGDPVLDGLKEEQAMVFDVGLGAFYKADKFYLGLALNRLLGSKASYSDEGVFSNKMHFYVNGGYDYQLPDYPLYTLQPSFMVKSDGVTTQVDISCLVKYDNKFWGGLSYRYQDAIAFLIGLRYKQFQVGYSYDLTTSDISRVGTGGSHEIFVNYSFNLNFDRIPKSYHNTRFL